MLCYISFWMWLLLISFYCWQYGANDLIFSLWFVCIWPQLTCSVLKFPMEFNTFIYGCVCLFVFVLNFRFVLFLLWIYYLVFCLFFPRFFSFHVCMFVFYFLLLLLLFDAFVVWKCFVDGIKILSGYFSHLYDTQKTKYSSLDISLTRN